MKSKSLLIIGSLFKNKSSILHLKNLYCIPINSNKTEVTFACFSSKFAKNADFKYRLSLTNWRSREFTAFVFFNQCLCIKWDVTYLARAHRDHAINPMTKQISCPVSFFEILFTNKIVRKYVTGAGLEYRAPLYIEIFQQNIYDEKSNIQNYWESLLISCSFISHVFFTN